MQCTTDIANTKDRAGTHNTGKTLTDRSMWVSNTSGREACVNTSELTMKGDLPQLMRVTAIADRHMQCDGLQVHKRRDTQQRVHEQRTY